MVKRLIACAFLVGCGTFEDPNVVLDLRIISMTATPPEQMVDVDLSKPLMPIDLLGQLAPAEVCGLIADPNFERNLRWTMTLCTLSAGRCDGTPTKLGSGLLSDPDLTTPEPRMCVTVQPDGNLLGTLLEALDGDTLHGLGGVDYGVSLQIGGETADPALDQFADKHLRVSPRIPADRAANNNPSLTGIQAVIDGGSPIPLPLGRCIDFQPPNLPLSVAPAQKVRLTPIEADGAREPYVVPTLDGKTRMFTESLKYQWVTTGGSLSKGSSGGPHDPFGNPAPLFTDWTAPKPADLAGPTDFSLWIVQRDERFGEAWYESCLHVEP
ncbi:MAG: hypothetical protein JWO36_3706 [Myxococcales bacterium]|nr:hypothetical protein [Myxococcales bacterium]